MPSLYPTSGELEATADGSVLVLDSAGHPIGNVPPARILVGRSGVPGDFEQKTALPADREFKLRFGIHGAARLFGFGFVGARGSA